MLKHCNGRDARCPSLLVAFVKEAIRAAVAAIMGVAGAALAGCTAVTTPADASHTIGVAVPIGSLAYDNILRRMLERGTFMTRATAQYFLNEFRIVGIDLTVPDGEDESLALVAADGTTKVADITVVSTDDGQRIVCTLASAVPAGTYYVRLVSHGLDPTAPLSTVLHKVAVKAAETPPVPIAESEDGTVKVFTLSDGGQSETFTAGHDWEMTGEGLFPEADPDRRWKTTDFTLRTGDDEFGVDYIASDDGRSLTVQAGDGGLEPGTYADAVLDIGLQAGDGASAEYETLHIPITFVISG